MTHLKLIKAFVFVENMIDAIFDVIVVVAVSCKSGGNV